MLRTLSIAIALASTIVTATLAQKAAPPVVAQPAVPAVPATAAPAVTATAANAPMQVFLVRSGPPGCEPHCTEWIAAQGQIDKSTLSQFRKVLAQIGNRRVPILIHSGGGTVDDAIEIGRLIRAKGLDVAVTKTEFAPCAPSDTACRKKIAKVGLIGTPAARLSYCASACAFILAGGVRRYVGPWTVLGVHQITSFQKHVRLLRTYQITTRRVWGAPVEVKKTLIGEKTIAEKTVQTQTKSSTYENVRQHFVAMGVDDSIMPILMAAPGTTIRWLTRAELAQTRIATEISLTGEQLIASAFPPKPAAPEPAAVASDNAAVARSAQPSLLPTPSSSPQPCALQSNQLGCQGMTMPSSWTRLPVPGSPPLAPAIAATTDATVATPLVTPPAATDAPASAITAQAAPDTPVAAPANAASEDPVRPRKIDKPKRQVAAPSAAPAAPAYDFNRSR